MTDWFAIHWWITAFPEPDRVSLRDETRLLKHSKR